MLRVVFVNRGRGLAGKLVRPPTYWVRRGDRIEYKPYHPTGADAEYIENHGEPIGLYLDGRRIGWLNHLNREWLVHVGKKDFCADHLYIDQLPYTLEGREWSADEAQPALCIFCGRKVWHVNDPKGRGSAWTCSVPWPPDGTYLYCNRPQCNNEHVWTCKVCHVDNLGVLPCHGCGGFRAGLERTAQVVHEEEDG